MIISFQDKRKRSRQRFLHEFKGCIAHSGVIGNMAEIVTDKRKIVFLRFDTLDTGHLLDRAGIMNITPQAVHGIGGVDDHAAVAQAFGYFTDAAGIGIFGINSD